MAASALIGLHFGLVASVGTNRGLWRGNLGAARVDGAVWRKVRTLFWGILYLG